jgi:LppM domain
LRLLALVGAVALLAGCRLDLNVAVDLAADGSGTVRVTATADADLLSRAPNAVADLRLDDAKAAGWTVTGPAGTESGGAQVVLTKPFGSPEQATAILAEINGPSGPLRGLTLTQAREFATVTSNVTGEVRLDGGLGAFADQALVQVAGKVPLADQVAASAVPLDQALGLTVTVDLPGTVTATNGTRAGGEVTWSPPLVEGQSTPLSASARKVDTAATRARNVEHWTSRALVGWGVLFALIVVLLVTRALWRRRRSALR